MSHTLVVPDTSAKYFAPAVEIVVHALPVEVHPTDGTRLWLGIISGSRCRVVPLSVSHFCDQPHLPANVFSSSDHDEDDLAPLEHCLLSGPSSTPHPLLDCPLPFLFWRLSQP